MFGWRLLHDDALAARAAWLGPLLPRPSGGLDRDPIALALASIAVLLALAYLVAALSGARPRARAALLALAAALLVALPTTALVAMGAATGRPYGQDGGVVQLPLAIDRILSGRSPYGADYSDSMLGREARVSDFWTEHGGNPILHHHAYLPGTHLLMMPFVALTRAAIGTFDPRVVTLLAFALAGGLAGGLGVSAEAKLVAAAAVWLNPLVYWPQIFGANDVLVAALLLAAVHLARRSRMDGAAALLGLACATKQLAWPFAPFLLAHLSGAGSLRELIAPPARGRLLRALAVAAGVFLVVVLPIAALDFRAFWGDIVVYNAGLPGGDNYPLGGTPGLGLANLLVYRGAVASLRDYVPLGRLYVLLVPLGLWLLRAQLRRGGLGSALVTGSVALLLSLFVSRVMHPNYLILAAILLPVALCAGSEVPVDAVIAGLGLLAAAVEIAEGQVFAATWTDAVAAHWPRAHGLLAALAPRAGPALTRDPLGLAFSAVASALGIALLFAAAVGARARARAVLGGVALLALAVIPASIVMTVGQLDGTPRVQDGWAAAVWPRHDGVRPPLKEAWSVSFRKDPPGAVSAGGPEPSVPPTAVLLEWLRVRDPRLVTTIALLLAAPLVALGGPGEATLRRTAVLLLPPALIGTVFGSSDVLLVAVAVPVLVAARGRRAREAAALAFVVVIATLLVVGARLRVPLLGPGLGLANLRLYFGAEPGARDVAGLALVGALAVGSILAASRLARGPGILAAAAAVLIAIRWVAPGVAPDDVAAPIALLAGAATAAGIDSPPAAL